MTLRRARAELRSYRAFEALDVPSGGARPTFSVDNDRESVGRAMPDKSGSFPLDVRSRRGMMSDNSVADFRPNGGRPTRTDEEGRSGQQTRRFLM